MSVLSGFILYQCVVVLFLCYAFHFLVFEILENDQTTSEKVTQTWYPLAMNLMFLLLTLFCL